MTSTFAEEGGKLDLALALFQRYRLAIRCPFCPGIQGKSGFNLDSAGCPTVKGLRRRFFACVYSNSIIGRSEGRKACKKATCTELIGHACAQLPQEDFVEVVRQTRDGFPAGSAFHLLIDSFMPAYIRQRRTPTSSRSEVIPRPDTTPFFASFSAPLEVTRRERVLPDSQESADSDSDRCTPLLSAPAAAAAAKRKATSGPDIEPEPKRLRVPGEAVVTPAGLEHPPVAGDVAVSPALPRLLAVSDDGAIRLAQLQPFLRVAEEVARELRLLRECLCGGARTPHIPSSAPDAVRNPPATPCPGGTLPQDPDTIVVARGHANGSGDGEAVALAREFCDAVDEKARKAIRQQVKERKIRPAFENALRRLKEAAA